MTTETDIRVWETENAETVVWGTHDPAAAYPAALAFYKSVSFAPEGLEEALAEDADRYWAEPSMIDEEVWPATSWRNEPVDGWTPYLVVTW